MDQLVMTNAQFENTNHIENRKALPIVDHLFELLLIKYCCNNF